MEVINQYKYILTDRFGVLEVAPLGEGDFSISNEQDEDGKYFYSKVFNGKIMFTGATFARLKKIEKSIYICTQQRLQVFRVCGDSEVLIFDGYFKLSDGDWNDEFCTVVLKFEKSTPDKCLSDNKTTKFNLLQVVVDPITVLTNTAGGVIEYKVCIDNSSTPISSPYWCSTGTPEDGNWVVYAYHDSSIDGSQFFVTTNWAREVVTVNCGENVPPDWILIEACVGGVEKYAKKVTLYDCVNTFESDPNTGYYDYTQNCKIVGYADGNTVIDNGRLLNPFIEYFVNQFCPDLNVVSDFFQINPENPSIINYVTGQTTEVDKLVLFQKADVKRPDALNNSTKAEWTFEKLIETLNFMFNVFYTIEDNTFRLEHISWFTREDGLDLTQIKYDKYTRGMRKYSYDIDGIPKIESWKFKEQVNGGAYTGDIDYSISCVSSGKDDEKIYLVDDLMTDVTFAMNNPGSDSNIVEDSGFVMVASKLVSGSYYIIQQQQLNDSLAWVNLIENYHFYNRPINKGIFNDSEVTFYSTKPIKKGKTVIVPIECGEVFDPSQKIKTVLGEGIVDKATFNLRTCMMELELKYDAFNNLTDNEPPTIQPENNFKTYSNQPKVFNVIVNDVDGVVVSVKCTIQPTNGVVEVMGISQIKYTPDLDFEGLDFFTLVATDNWGEESDPANFVLTVLPSNQPPVAQDDNFTVYHETAPFIGNVIANDSDDFGFNIVTPNVTTAQGVAVTISSNGNFMYSPPTGFVGIDSFQYTIEDNTGAQSTATVTLNVAFNSIPVAVNDTYQTLQDSILITDGSPEKPTVLINDYIISGVGYPLTATPETKPTLLGGNVIIYADGTFNYTPPSGVVSQIDSFDYTANNSNGNDVGTVQVAIIAVIYVKIVQSDNKIIGHPSQPNWGNSADYTLYFYSDPLGNIPLDVTGLGFQVNIKEHNVISSDSGSSSFDYIWRTGILNGTSYKIYNDYVYNEFSSSGGSYNSLNITISIQNGAYNILT